MDYARHKIRVNCLCLGLILTERSSNHIKQSRGLAEDKQPFNPLGFGEPLDVAYAALFLASDESKIITGCVIPVDSGYTAIGRIDNADLVIRSSSKCQENIFPSRN